MKKRSYVFFSCLIFFLVTNHGIAPMKDSKRSETPERRDAVKITSLDSKQKLKKTNELASLPPNPPIDIGRLKAKVIANIKKQKVGKLI